MDLLSRSRAWPAARSRAARFLIASGLAVASLGSPATAQRALLLQGGHPVAVASSPNGTHAALARVIAGPTSSEYSRGMRTAVPSGTRFLGTSRHGDRLRIELGKRFLLLARRPHQLDLAIEQLAKTVFAIDPSLRAVDLYVENLTGELRPLPELLYAAGTGPSPEREFPQRPQGSPETPTAQSNVSGALSGRTIVVSPGHGYYWHATLGWTTQRPLIDGLLEDIHVAEIANRYLIPYLENLGARVISCRERGEITAESVLDNDRGSAVYAETGSWLNSGSAGYAGGTYRFAITGPASSATATWTATVPRDGKYPVYAWFRAGTNRAPDAHYRIHHAGGVADVERDQRRDNQTWVFLGEYSFRAGVPARITLTNRSGSPGTVVIADAIKFGGGVGDIARGGAPSGQPRWREASRYWAQYSGAPSSVWNSSSADNNDDVTCRPRYAEWRGADCYISLHTNAGGGTGTDTFLYNGGATPGSANLAAEVQSRLIADIRQHYDSSWVDRGVRQANFGELRLLSSMPGVLVEMAFHDTAGSRDHRALHDPKFRRVAARAYARGVLRHFVPGAPFPPERPTALRVQQDGLLGLAVSWQGVTGASEYVVEQSSDGKGFVEVARTSATRWNTGRLPHGTALSFRVRARNATGRSMPTEVLTARTSHTGTAELLLVQGFDRLGRSVKAPDNTFDYLARVGIDIASQREFSLGFDAASNEAVQQGAVRLTPYRAVYWSLGEESTSDDTFDATEQSLLSAYLGQGGRALISGSEIGWDLIARGSPSDATFYRGILGADYVRDDAGTYQFRSTPAGIFAGLPAGSFDDGSGPTYDVDFPDVLTPADASSTPCLEYATGLGQVAGLQRDDGTSRAVLLGFPLETVRDDGLRRALLTRSLRYLLDGRSLQVPARVNRGSSAPLQVRVSHLPGRSYLLAASLGIGPGLELQGRVLPLAFDGAFSASLEGGSPVFVNFVGSLDANGQATATFAVPNLTVLAGTQFYFSGLVTILDSPPILGRMLPWVSVRID